MTNSPQLVTYKVHSKTISEMTDEINLEEWENSINPIVSITEHFRELYGPKVKVQVSLTHNTVTVEYD